MVILTLSSKKGRKKTFFKIFVYSGPLQPEDYDAKKKSEKKNFSAPKRAATPIIAATLITAPTVAYGSGSETPRNGSRIQILENDTDPCGFGSTTLGWCSVGYD
jgi:hypothetical protein